MPKAGKSRQRAKLSKTIAKCRNFNRNSKLAKFYVYVLEKKIKERNVKARDAPRYVAAVR